MTTIVNLARFFYLDLFCLYYRDIVVDQFHSWKALIDNSTKHWISSPVLTQCSHTHHCPCCQFKYNASNSFIFLWRLNNCIYVLSTSISHPRIFCCQYFLFLLFCVYLLVWLRLYSWTLFLSPLVLWRTFLENLLCQFCDNFH